MPPVTISRANWKLALDARDLDGALIASRKEISAAKRAMNELATPLEKYESEVEKATSLLKFGAEGQELYNRALERAKKRYKEASISAEDRAAALAKEKMEQKKLVEAQRELNDQRRHATAIINRQKTPLQKLQEEESKLHILAKRGLLTDKQRGAEIGRLRRQFALETKAVGRLSKAYSFLKKSKFIGLIGAGVSAGSVVASIKRDLTEIDVLAKTSEKLGVELNTLSQLQFTIQKDTGIQAERTNKLLEKMVVRTSQAAQGTGEAQASIKELGLDAAKLVKLAPDKMFLRYADAIKQVKSEQDKLRISVKLFDDENAGVFRTLERGSDAIRKSNIEAGKLVGNLSKLDVDGVVRANDAIQGLESAFAGFSREFTASIAPSLTTLVQEMTTLLKDLRSESGSGGPASGVVDLAGGFVGSLDANIKNVSGTVGKLMDNSTSLTEIPGITVDFVKGVYEAFPVVQAMKNMEQRAQDFIEVNQRKKRVEAETAKAAEEVSKSTGALMGSVRSFFGESADAVKARKDAFMYSLDFNSQLREARRRRLGDGATETSRFTFGPLASASAGSFEAFRFINTKTQSIQIKQTKAAERTATNTEEANGYLGKIVDVFESFTETNLS